jgi:hypothetical protein
MPDVDNLAFFRIVDKQAREAMQQVETELLPTARKALSETGLSLGEYPIEGYYGKSRELTEYFNHIRTLQLNFSDKVGDSVRRLHDFYTDEVFGLGQSVATAINSEGVWYPAEPPAVISPMVDPLTVVVAKVGSDPRTAYDDLTIENLAKELEGAELGKGLVGFGSLVDRVERGGTGKHNPVATTLARETTVLSAHVPTLRSMPEYRVSPEVEQGGNEVIDAYNALFSASGFDARIGSVTKKNAFALNHDLPEMCRCVRIFNLELPGSPKEFYHWAVGNDGYGPKVFDFWRNEVVTTDMFKQSPERYQA